MSEEIKFMNIKDFREEGYLQELNRIFLHPLGLALQINIDDDGVEHLGGIWDYREDGEGIHYNLTGSNNERNAMFFKKAQNIKNLLGERMPKRQHLLGFVVEPVHKVESDETNIKID